MIISLLMLGKKSSSAYVRQLTKSLGSFALSTVSQNLFQFLISPEGIVNDGVKGTIYI